MITLTQRPSWRIGRALLSAVLAVTGLCIAQAAAAQRSDADLPGRVARLSELSGQVWLYTPDASEWIGAVRNRPLTSGDRLATDAGGRAELQIGSTTLRVDGGTELEILQLDDDRLSVQLHAGSAAARLRSAEAAREFTLTTEEGRFRADISGRYRFDRIDRVSHVTVTRGQAVYEGTRSALTVASGQHARFWIDSAGVAQYSLGEPLRDSFAGWSNDRDGYDDRDAVASRYVSPEMTGADDLDRYGVWQQSPDYGALWIPRGVSAGWAPYSSGHWAHVRPWGWTWVDDAPWGFAPFHYGRWVYVRNTWCWAPGSRVGRPIYAPALVGWVGGSNVNFSVSIGSGPAVGWFPLGPRDVYVPSYRYSPRYVRDINITHVTNVTYIDNVVRQPPERREFANRKFPHALTVVPTTVVVNRQPVGPAAAEWRTRGLERNLGDQPARITTLTEPPVRAPVATARVGEPRAVLRPPIGVGRTEAGGIDAVRPRIGGREAQPGSRAAELVRPPVAAAVQTEPGGPNSLRPIPVRPSVNDDDRQRIPPRRIDVPSPPSGIGGPERRVIQSPIGIDRDRDRAVQSPVRPEVRQPPPGTGFERQMPPPPQAELRRAPPVPMANVPQQQAVQPSRAPQPVTSAPAAPPPRLADVPRPIAPATPAAPATRPQVPERIDRSPGPRQLER